jgi:anti-sigma regulatory factor (Ser/Thr protein kinase)
LRKSVALLAQNLGLSNLRIMDLETAVGEAAMNAVRHAAGGEALVRGDAETGLMQVWIEDAGTGIAEDMIHRAVERGFTTGGFGQGFFLMRSCGDRVYLLTGPRGTTVVLEVERNEPDPAWLADYTQAS